MGKEFNRRVERRRFLLWSGVVLSVVLAAQASHVKPLLLFDAQGVRNAADLMSGLLHPDFSAEFLSRIVRLSAESILIGVLGTMLAVILGIVFAVVITRVPALADPPGRHHRLAAAGTALQWSVRLVMNALRSIPEIVWAYLLVQFLGLGPGPAVLAIALTSGGIIGKLYAELAETVDPGAVQSLRARGVSRWGIWLFGVIPQVSRQWTAYVLFRLECNIRSGTILGVVGAGGLGSEIALSVRYFEFDKLATTLLAVLIIVVFLEVSSANLRRYRSRWTIALGFAGGAVALLWLDIPWASLFSTSPLLGSFRSDTWQFAALSHAVVLSLQTIGMAWVATLSAAVFAFLLAPLATRPLTTGTYLHDVYRRRGPMRLVNWLLLGGSRLLMQLTRGMPELTLAILFVVWVGPGATAGVLAIAVHSIGVLGRLYTDVYEEVEPGPPRALQASGSTAFAVWVYGVLPQVLPRVLAFTLYRFEVNIRFTAMVGFVGAGGIGDALHTAISLFHLSDLVVLLTVMLAVVTAVDAIGAHLRLRILRGAHARQRLSSDVLETTLEHGGPGADLAVALQPAQVRYRLSDEHPFIATTQAQLSVNGVVFKTGGPLSAGQIVQLEIQAPDGTSLYSLAQVEHDEVHAGLGFLRAVHLRFINPDPAFVLAVQALSALPLPESG